MTEDSLIDSGWRSNTSIFTGAFLLQSQEEDMIPMEPFQSLPILTNFISNESNTRLPTGFNSSGNLQANFLQSSMSIFAFISRNEGGNYIAYSRNVATSTWFRCLENSITPISEEMALNAMRVATLIFYGLSLERRFYHDFMPLPYFLVTSMMGKPKAIDVAGAPIFTALRIEQNHALLLAQEAASRALQQEQQQVEMQNEHEKNSRQRGNVLQRRLQRTAKPAVYDKTPLLRRLFMKSDAVRQQSRPPTILKSAANFN